MRNMLSAEKEKERQNEEPERSTSSPSLLQVGRNETVKYVSEVDSEGQHDTRRKNSKKSSMNQCPRSTRGKFGEDKSTLQKEH